MNGTTWLILIVLVGAITSAAFIAYRRLGPSEPARPKLGLDSRIPRRYTKHVRERMAERGITTEQIEATIADPEQVAPDSNENSMRYTRRFDDVLVKVWVAAEPWPPKDEVVIKSTAGQYERSFEIPKTAVPRVIGTDGQTVNEIRRTTGAMIRVRDSGTVVVSAGDRWRLDMTCRKIDELASRALPNVGQSFVGEVTAVRATGVTVAIPSGDRGFLPVVFLRPLVNGRRIEDLSDVVSVGQRLQVEVSEIREGRLRFKLAAPG